MEAFWRNVLRLFFIVLLIDEIISSNLHEEDLCQLKDNGIGVCLSIAKCETEIDLKSYTKHNNPKICTFNDFSPVICCPTNIIPGMIAKLKCHEYSSVYNFCDTVTKFIFDTSNKTGKFPFVVSLGYGNEPNITWECSGTLISEQWVLSAAHCTTLYSKGPVKYARLGFVNFDSNEGEIVGIIDHKNHPDYTDKLFYNDISLLKLERPLKLSKTMYPVCLPYRLSTSNSYFSTSYGKSFLDYDYEDYDVKKMFQTLHNVTLNSYNESNCNLTFHLDSHLDEGFNKKTQLCLRVKEGIRDACRGDSGDGVYLANEDNKCFFDIVGVSSAATTFCGTTNSFNIFTKINPYVGWIEKIVWPEFFAKGRQ